MSEEYWMYRLNSDMSWIVEHLKVGYKTRFGLDLTEPSIVAGSTWVLRDYTFPSREAAMQALYNEAQERERKLTTELNAAQRAVVDIHVELARERTC